MPVTLGSLLEAAARGPVHLTENAQVTIKPRWAQRSSDGGGTAHEEFRGTKWRAAVRPPPFRRQGAGWVRDTSRWCFHVDCRLLEPNRSSARFW
jgi:hypothetical protein